MPHACRLRLGSVTGLASLTLLAACAGAQSQSGYQEQQQAAFYGEMLQQQALAQAAQPQPAAATQAAPQGAPAAQIPPQALTVVAAQRGAAPAVDLTPARIDGQPVTSAELAAHQDATGLPRAQALTDLIDVTLLKTAASRHGLPIPAGALTGAARTDLERALADKLDLEPADAPNTTVHAAVRARLLEGKVIEILELPGTP